MRKNKMGVKTTLAAGTLDSILKLYSMTDRNKAARRILFTEGLKPIVKWTGWLDYEHMLNKEGKMVRITSELSVEMRRMIAEGEYPWIITEKELFRIL